MKQHNFDTMMIIAMPIIMLIIWLAAIGGLIALGIWFLRVLGVAI